jgi:hypothetical protein
MSSISRRVSALTAHEGFDEGLGGFALDFMIIVESAMAQMNWSFGLDPSLRSIA